MKNPILLRTGNHRHQFADFLDRLVAGSAHPDEWSSFVVMHYPDEFLEEIRRCVVRLAIGQLPLSLESPEGRQVLRAWAMAVRSAARKDTVSSETTENE
jgi:hypothetical protein